MFNNKGYTLVEVMTVVGILLLVFLITGDMIINSLKTTRYESEQATAIETARKSMGIITKDIRGANTSERGDYPLVIVQDDELAFFNDIDNDGVMEKIRYYLEGAKLVKEIYLPGLTLNYSSLSASSTVADYVNNNGVPLFSYYDSNSEETDIINNIRMIEVIVVINVTPTTLPNDYILKSNVNLRNLKNY
jgi:prepilin-type N-terminal cleavage/methylation domain-containing protein